MSNRVFIRRANRRQVNLLKPTNERAKWFHFRGLILSEAPRAWLIEPNDLPGRPSWYPITDCKIIGWSGKRSSVTFAIPLWLASGKGFDVNEYLTRARQKKERAS